MGIDIAALKRQAGEIWISNKTLQESQANALGDFFLSHKLSTSQVIALLQMKEPEQFAAELATYLWSTHQNTLLRASKKSDVIKTSIYKVHSVDPSLSIALAQKLNYTEEEKQLLKQKPSKSNDQLQVNLTNSFEKVHIHSLFEKNVLPPYYFESLEGRRAKRDWEILDQNHGTAITKLADEAKHQRDFISSGIYPSSTPSTTESWLDKFNKFKQTIFNLFNDVTSTFTNKKAASPRVKTPELKKSPVSASSVIKTPEFKATSPKVKTPELKSPASSPVILTPTTSPTKPSSSYQTTSNIKRNLLSEFNASGSKENRVFLTYSSVDSQGNKSNYLADITNSTVSGPKAENETSMPNSVNQSKPSKQSSYSSAAKSPEQFLSKPTTCAAEATQTQSSVISTPPRKGLRG